MKFNKYIFLASAVLSLTGTVVFFLYQNFQRGDGFPSDFAVLLSAVIFILAINYLIINYLWLAFSRKQIKRISGILPDVFKGSQKENLNFKEFGERVSLMREKTASELDTMKEMEKYRREYVGNISHELKTPLFTLQGYVETLIDDGGENPGLHSRYLGRIDQSVQRLLAIVQDLDLINQYEYGTIRLVKTDFDLNRLILEILDLLDLEAQKSSARLLLESSSTAVLVHADKHKISQVFLNLLSNAIHYANREKAVIQVHTETVGDKVLIQVSDNGMGIKPDLLPRIFERFFRVESSRNRREGGSGLGLAIVKHVLEAHNQPIHVESVYLEGTKFYFYLDTATGSAKM